MKNPFQTVIIVLILMRYDHINNINVIVHTSATRPIFQGPVASC